jgi:hypothetical protein
MIRDVSCETLKIFCEQGTNLKHSLVVYIFMEAEIKSKIRKKISNRTGNLREGNYRRDVLRRQTL